MDPKTLLGAPQSHLLTGAIGGHAGASVGPSFLARLLQKPTPTSQGWKQEWVHALGWARVSEGGQPRWWEAKPGSLDPAPPPSTSERDLQRAQNKASTPSLAKNIKKKLWKIRDPDVNKACDNCSVSLKILISLNCSKQAAKQFSLWYKCITEWTGPRCHMLIIMGVCLHNIKLAWICLWNHTFPIKHGLSFEREFRLAWHQPLYRAKEAWERWPHCRYRKKVLTWLLFCCAFRSLCLRTVDWWSVLRWEEYQKRRQHANKCVCQK